MMKFNKLVVFICIPLMHSFIMATAYDEKNIHTLIKQFLPDNAIVLEAGAFNGIDTRILARLFAHGTIHAFEPFPSSFEKLIKAVHNFKNVKCYPYALNDKTGKSTFYLRPSNHGANSILPPALEAPLFSAQTIEVDTIEPDKWAQQYNIQRVDAMWLDMEGLELVVLKSAKEILKSVKVIYTEINFQKFRENNTMYYELREWLEKQGFTEVWKRVGVVKPKRYTNLNKKVAWQGNALFVRL
jgi:FkbM family methyltransferase